MTEAPLLLDKVRDELENMKLMYPHSQITAATIEITAPMWLKDCRDEGMSGKDFEDACSMARRSSPTFPTVGKVVKAHRELMAGSRSENKPKELPVPQISEEQRKRNAQHCRNLLEALKNDFKSPEQKRDRRGYPAA